MATTTLVASGLYLVLVLEAADRKRGSAVLGLCVLLGGAYVMTHALSSTRDFFAFAGPSPFVLATAVSGATLALVGLWLSDDRFAPGGAHEAAPRR